jgi:hypothetical protein
MSTEKMSRLAHANAVLRAMASHGRRFFYSQKADRFAEIVIDPQGRLRIVDECTGKSVLIVKGGRWRGFGNGGTCRSIVEDLANYVRTGKKTRNHFGPWPEWVNGGDLWGYGDDASKVRDDLRGNPAVHG